MSGVALSQYHFAWVTHQNTTYFVRSLKEVFQPTSAAQKLMQEIFEKFHDQSFFILRNPIFTTAEKDAATQSMVKVIAKRIRFSQDQLQMQTLTSQKIELGDPNLFFSKSEDQLNSELAVADFWTPTKNHEEFNIQQARLLLERTLATIPQGPVLHDYHRAIVAVLVNENHQVVSITKNTNARSKSLHAEINLVQSWFSKNQCKIPKGFKIFTSLKPCRMCADLIAHCSADDVPVYYLHNDPGPLAQGSQIEHRLLQMM